mmetsp:Transcript_6011/g.17858  ORF Transcript_6011/g.17858 Transcript_6011/m.17858 type:complete len:205 (+) Transcript_6011:1031-1645(+)
MSAFSSSIILTNSLTKKGLPSDLSAITSTSLGGTLPTRSASHSSASRSAPCSPLSSSTPSSPAALASASYDSTRADGGMGRRLRQTSSGFTSAASVLSSAQLDESIQCTSSKAITARQSRSLWRSTASITQMVACFRDSPDMCLVTSLCGMGIGSTGESSGARAQICPSSRIAASACGRTAWRPSRLRSGSWNACTVEYACRHR